MLYFIWLANQYSLYNIGGFLVAKAIAGLTGIAGGLFSLCYNKTPRTLNSWGLLYVFDKPITISLRTVELYEPF